MSDILRISPGNQLSGFHLFQRETGAVGHLLAASLFFGINPISANAAGVSTAIIAITGKVSISVSSDSSSAGSASVGGRVSLISNQAAVIGSVAGVSAKGALAARSDSAALGQAVAIAKYRFVASLVCVSSSSAIATPYIDANIVCRSSAVSTITNTLSGRGSVSGRGLLVSMCMARKLGKMKMISPIRITHAAESRIDTVLETTSPIRTKMECESRIETVFKATSKITELV